MARCIIVLGSNTDVVRNMELARRELLKHYPDIRFSTEVTTEAVGCRFNQTPFRNQTATFVTDETVEQVRSLLKAIERISGRCAEEKEREAVRLDLDLIAYDEHCLKPADWERNYVKKGIAELNQLITDTPHIDDTDTFVLG